MRDLFGSKNVMVIGGIVDPLDVELVKLEGYKSIS